jgi:hypothetical protein
MKDEVLERLWEIKDELAREANYDVQLLCRELKKRQTASRSQIVDRAALLKMPAKAQPTAGVKK